MSSIHYIGHGKLESSPENFSILHVVAHELSHVQEFKNQAFRENADIAEIRVKIDYEMRENGKLVAVSGETSAVTKKRPETDSSKSLFEPYSKEKKNVPNLQESMEEMNEGDENSDPTRASKSNEKISELNLLSRKDYLETKLKSVESELKGMDRDTKESLVGNSSRSLPLHDRLADLDQELQNQNQPSSGNLETDPKRQELIREKRKVEEEIRLLKMEEDTKRNFQFLSNIHKNLVENAFSIGINSLSGSNLNVQA